MWRYNLLKMAPLLRKLSLSDILHLQCTCISEVNKFKSYQQGRLLGLIILAQIIYSIMSDEIHITI